MDRNLHIEDGGCYSEVMLFAPDGLLCNGSDAAAVSGCDLSVAPVGAFVDASDGSSSGMAGVPASGSACGPASADQALEAEIVMGRDSKLNLVIVILPGVSKDISLSVRLEGEGAHMETSGLYLCPDAERVNIRLNVCHNVPQCTSHQLFKGIVAGHALTSFHGLIRVATDAQKTEAYQENHNLLLSSTAEARTKPQLEIYADDVKCSHGATVGRLSEEEQFYMRSRGISEEDARMLQMVSFLSPVISRIEDEARRAEISALVSASLRAFSNAR